MELEMLDRRPYINCTWISRENRALLEGVFQAWIHYQGRAIKKIKKMKKNSEAPLPGPHDIVESRL
jgi:hypothetical protein